MNGFLILVVGGVVMLAGLLAVVAGLFRDRPRGRRRCPSCWYDLGGGAGLTCPECGHTARSERRLARTRRRWSLVALGALLLAAGAASPALPHLTHERVAAWTPVTGLVLALPWMGDEQGAYYTEFQRRCLQPPLPQDWPSVWGGAEATVNLWPWQRSLLARRAASMLSGHAQGWHRNEALRILHALGPEAAPVTGALLAEYRVGGIDESQLSAVIAAIGPGAAEAVPLLHERLLAPVGRSAATPALVEASVWEGLGMGQRLAQYESREPLVQALGAIGSASAPAVPALVQLLEPEQTLLHPRVVRALGQIGPGAGEAVPALVRILRDRLSHSREAAVKAIGQIGPTDAAAEALAEALLGASVALRERAAEAIRPHPSALRVALHRAVERASSPHASVVSATMHGLLALGPNAAPASAAMVRAMDSTDPVVRYVAARALRASGVDSPEARRAFERAADDHTTYVRREATDALAELDGRRDR